VGVPVFLVQLLLICCSELILSELLLAFSFDPVSEPIDWKMGIAIEPRFRGRENEGLQVPVRITVLQQVNNLRGPAPVGEV
jgi:hypothetical protein